MSVLSIFGGESSSSIELSLVKEVTRLYKIWKVTRDSGKSTEAIESFIAGMYELGCDINKEVTQGVFVRIANLMTSEEAQELGKKIGQNCSAINKVVADTPDFDKPIGVFIEAHNSN